MSYGWFIFDQCHISITCRALAWWDQCHMMSQFVVWWFFNAILLRCSQLITVLVIWRSSHPVPPAHPKQIQIRYLCLWIVVDFQWFSSIHVRTRWRLIPVCNYIADEPLVYHHDPVFPLLVNCFPSTSVAPLRVTAPECSDQRAEGVREVKVVLGRVPTGHAVLRVATPCCRAEAPLGGIVGSMRRGSAQ